MTVALRMVVLSVVSAIAVAGIFVRQSSLEVLLGMFGPLVAVAATAVIAERVFRQRPEALTAMMITAFAAKLVFFMVYVTVMIRVLSLRPVPFVISFTAYFIVLYFIESLHLKRLFWGGTRA